MNIQLWFHFGINDVPLTVSKSFSDSEVHSKPPIVSFVSVSSVIKGSEHYLFVNYSSLTAYSVIYSQSFFLVFFNKILTVPRDI